MVRKAVDTRSIRTKEKLREGALDLLAESEKFSIHRLLTHCNITRGTFYRHYNNQADIVKDANHALINKITNKTENKFRVRQVLEIILDNGVLFNSILNDGHDLSLMKDLMEVLRSQRNQIFKDIHDDEVRIRMVYQWETIISGFWGTVAFWLREPKSMTYDELNDEFRTVWRVTMSRSQETALRAFDFDA